MYSVNLYGGWDGAPVVPSCGPASARQRAGWAGCPPGDLRGGRAAADRRLHHHRGYAINNGGGIYVFDGLPSFRNNLITDNWGTTYGGALYTAGGGANVENNRIIANETEYGGTLIFGSGTQGEVHGNLFADNLADYGSAVHIDKASLSFTHNILRTNTGSVVEINRGTGVIVITNNLFYDNPSTSVRLQNESNANVFHNTFATSPNSALVINYNSSATFSNNIVTHCGGASLVKNDTSTISGTNNLFYWNGSNPNLLTNELVQDPQYIDEALDNYQLQRGSPAVDFGVDLGVLDDLLLVRRPIGLAPDLGAYERLIYIYLPLVMKP